MGLEVTDSKKLNALLIEICKEIILHGYEGDRSKSIDVILLKRGHSFVVVIEDKGLPFDYKSFEHSEVDMISTYISKGYADRVNYSNLGPAGNKIELIRELKSTDIREHLHHSEHIELLNASEAHPDEKLEVRFVKTEEVIDLVRLVYRCYGYTYANEFMYFPEQVESRIRTGIMKSCGVFNSTNEIVGHLAILFDRVGAKVAESGVAVVNPRYRGHGIYKRSKLFLKGWAASNGVIGTYGEAVTVHPYSQKGSIEMGGHEVGFLLGYSPGTVSFKKISDKNKNRRQSIALIFTPILESSEVPLFPPAEYKHILEAIYNRLGFSRNFIGEKSIAEEISENGRLTLSIRPDHNQAFIVINQPGKNIFQQIHFHFKQLCLKRFDCIYIDLPLGNPSISELGSRLREIGFFFGGVIPELRGGDVLRMQYLNNVEISKDDIAIASEFGEYLLEKIFEDKSSV